MITLYSSPVRLSGGVPVPLPAGESPDRAGTLAYSILSAHDLAKTPGKFSVRFDSLISHDITYVGVIQTASASGMTRFPVPYVLTNCHNSLCAVGGTINADDHAFGLSAAKKYGGVYVQANMAVIHQYAREELAGCGRMILGSDSHTRYGALGAMGVGEGGPELVKQLLGGTWDAPTPEVVLVWLTGEPPRGVGPHDAAIALCGSTYKDGFVKNSILEFAGPGMASLTMSDRIAICNLCVEAGAKTALMEVDDITMDYLAAHGGRTPAACFKSDPDAKFEKVYDIDLSTIVPVVAKPHFVDNIAPVSECTGVKINEAFLGSCNNGRLEDLRLGASIIKGRKVAPTVRFLVVPASREVYLAAMKEGILDTFMEAGAIVMNPNCSVCWGSCQGVIGEGEVLVSTGTRNFKGRAGHRDSFVYLGSAATVTSSAVKGEICGPQDL